jgi:hypothetical protein
MDSILLADTISLAGSSILHGNPAMLCEQTCASLPPPRRFRRSGKAASSAARIKLSYVLIIESMCLMAPPDNHLNVSLWFCPKRRHLLRASFTLAGWNQPFHPAFSTA